MRVSVLILYVHRVEHPQQLIDEARYGEEDAALVQRGKGPVPVAGGCLGVSTWFNLYNVPSGLGSSIGPVTSMQVKKLY